MTQHLDERFLTVHPRTALWWEQREKCAGCAHLEVQPSDAGTGGGWACLACPGGGGGGLRAGFTTCITAREEGHGVRCGPDARLFQAKQLEAA